MQVKQALSIINLHIWTLLVSAGLAWTVLALCDFGYSILFEHLHIEEFIEKMGPLNYHKAGFDLLTKQDYVRLFHDINTAIHFKPSALNAIYYEIKSPSAISLSVSLLREAEVIHLQDVSRLIKFCFYLFGFSVLFLILTVRKASRVNGLTFKKLCIQLGLLWAVLIGMSMLIYLTKPVAVFYWLHELIFPADHQWFFYYQDSLMTTLMKAPDIFGPITVALLFLTLVFQFLLLAGFALNREKIPLKSSEVV